MPTSFARFSIDISEYPYLENKSKDFDKIFSFVFIRPPKKYFLIPL